MKRLSLFVASIIFSTVGSLTHKAIGAARAQVLSTPTVAEKEFLVQQRFAILELLDDQAKKMHLADYIPEQINHTEQDSWQYFLAQEKIAQQERQFVSAFLRSQQERLEKERIKKADAMKRAYFTHQAYFALEYEGKDAPRTNNLPSLTARSTVLPAHPQTSSITRAPATAYRSIPDLRPAPSPHPVVKRARTLAADTSCQ